MENDFKFSTCLRFFHNKMLERNKQSGLSVTERHQLLAFRPERLGRGWTEQAGAELCEHDSFPGVRTRDAEPVLMALSPTAAKVDRILLVTLWGIF